MTLPIAGWLVGIGPTGRPTGGEPHGPGETPQARVAGAVAPVC
jgi:hypothetical protein